MANVKECLEILLSGCDLEFQQASDLLNEIFAGTVEEVKIAAILTAIRVKGPTSAELAGFAKSLRQHAVKIETGIDSLIDTCGTGGSKIKTFNISTAAALVAAGAGAKVAKHGNRAITSSCGSADVLAALGVKIDCAPEKVSQCIMEANVGFMFAPLYHPAMRFVQPIRRGLGFMTIFNMLGPLANPAGAKMQVLGVPDEKLMDLMADALVLLGAKYVMIVHSAGLDEIDIAGPTKIIAIKNGEKRKFDIEPAKLGFENPCQEEIKGSDASANAAIIRDVLGSIERGARRNVVVLNSAAAIMVSGLAEDFESAIDLAAKSIDNGRAAQCLDKLIAISNG